MKIFLLMLLIFSCESKKEAETKKSLVIDDIVVYTFPKSKQEHCILAMAKMQEVMQQKLDEAMDECFQSLKNVQPDIQKSQARELCRKSKNFQELFSETGRILDQTNAQMADSCKWEK